MAIEQRLIGYQNGRPMYKSYDTSTGQYQVGVTYGGSASQPSVASMVSQGNTSYNQWASKVGASAAGSVGSRPVSRPGAGVGCTPRSWTDPDTGQIRYNTNAPGGRAGGQMDPNWKPASIQIDRANRTLNVNGEFLSYTPLEKPYKDSVYNETEWDAYATRIGVAKVLPRPGSGCGIESGQLYNKEYNRIMNEIGGPLNEPAPVWGTGSTTESRKKSGEKIYKPEGWTKSKTRNAQGNYDWIQTGVSTGLAEEVKSSSSSRKSSNSFGSFGGSDFGLGFGGSGSSRKSSRRSLDNPFF